VPALANGASVSIDITVLVTLSTDIVNTARIEAAGQPDPDSVAGNSDGTEDDIDGVTIHPVAPAPALASVTGVLWVDADGDTVHDPTEAAISGAHVRLLSLAGDV
jgi:hypothetical protein